MTLFSLDEFDLPELRNELESDGFLAKLKVSEDLPTLGILTNDSDEFFDIQFESEPLEDLTASTSDTAFGFFEGDEQLDLDLESIPAIWTTDVELQSLQDISSTWEAFDDPTASIHSRLQANHNLLFKSLPQTHVKSQIHAKSMRDVTLQSLCNLVAGRCSSLYTWHDDDQVFRRMHERSDSVPSSPRSNDKLYKIVEQGSHMRRLRGLVNIRKEESATTTALKYGISTTLDFMDAWIAQRLPTMQSASQVLSTSSSLQSVLLLLQDMIKEKHSMTDDEYLLHQHNLLTRRIRESNRVAPLVTALMKLVSTPWTQRILQQTAVLPVDERDEVRRKNSQTDQTLINLDEQLHKIDTELSFLREHCPTHLLLLPDYDDTLVRDIVQSNDLDIVHKYARQLETQQRGSSKSMSNEAGKTLSSSSDVSQKDEDLDHLGECVLYALTNDAHLDVEPYSPFERVQPTLTMQANLLHQAVLQHIFEASQLTQHFDSIRNLYLCGDGKFVSRFTDAVFHSNDRMKNGRPTSLQLNDPKCNEWPPSSSQLSQCLSSVLPDQSSHINTLQRYWSFGIQELEGAEFEQAFDPSSTHALDFLRLRYQPPPSLESIFTPDVMSLYEEIFGHLLLHLRLIDVVTKLRSSIVRRGSTLEKQQHRIAKGIHDMHFTMTILATYAFRTAIELPCHHFMQQIQAMQQNLSDHAETKSTTMSSIEEIHKLHTSAVVSIRSRLFLNKQHQQIYGCINDLFATVIAFGRSSDDDDSLTSRFADEASHLLQALANAIENANNDSRSCDHIIDLLAQLDWKRDFIHLYTMQEEFTD